MFKILNKLYVKIQNMKNPSSEINVFDVAKYIIEKQGRISTLKLQKLIYYSYVWTYTFHGEMLFTDPIQAWTNGPVTPSLWLKMKYENHVDTCKFSKNSSEKIPNDIKHTIDRVLLTYGDMTGEQLKNLTHQEGPWNHARTGLSPDEPSKKEITLDSIERFYGNPEQYLKIKHINNKRPLGFLNCKIPDEFYQPINYEH